MDTNDSQRTGLTSASNPRSARNECPPKSLWAAAAALQAHVSQESEQRRPTIKIPLNIIRHDTGWLPRACTCRALPEGSSKQVLEKSRTEVGRRFGTDKLFIFQGANRTLGCIGTLAVFVGSNAARVWRPDVMALTNAKRVFGPLM
jgi:hypothetical protein